MIVRHFFSLEFNLKVNVIVAQIIVLQVLHELWLLFFEGRLEWGEGLRGNNPWGNSGAEVLGIEGS